MKAVALTGVSKLEICEKSLPEVDEYSILLKVRAVSVCGSDLRVFKNGDDRFSYPRILGHEIAGEIVAKGTFVQNFAIGDRVCLGAHVPCGECQYCQENLGHHCVQRWTVGYQFDGGFAEYVVLNRLVVENGSICKIANQTSFEEGSLSEPFSCVISGLRKLSIKAGEAVTVYGAGAIGCMFIAALKKMGVGKIIVVQRSSERRKFAKQIGADVCIDPGTKDIEQQILKETGGYGCDAAIITVPSNEMQNLALSSVRKTGRVLFFAGLPKKDRTNYQLDTNQITYKELSIFGVHGASKSDHKEAVRWIDEKLIDFSIFITNRYRLEETEKAFTENTDQLVVKKVIVPH